MDVVRCRVPIQTDASGDFTTVVNAPAGMFLQVRYVVDGTSPLDTGADLTIEETDTGLNLLAMANIGTSSFTRLPRQLIADAADGVVKTTYDYLAIHDTVTVTIAEGGDSKVGVLYIYIGT